MTGQPFQELESAGNDSGVVYVYRPYASVGGWSCVKFSIDGGEPRSLSNGGYLRIELSPGKHQLTTVTSWCFAFPLQQSFRVEKGDMAFVRLINSESWAPGSFRGSQMGDPWTRYENVTPQVAREELKKLYTPD